MKQISITDVKDKVDFLSTSEKNSFSNFGHVFTVMIEAGDSLWRFVSKKGSNPYSDCWIDSESMNFIMQIIYTQGDYSIKAKKEAVGPNLAILKNWNSLDYRVKITFKKNIIAYSGQTGPQKLFSSDKELSEKYGRPVEKAVEYKIGGLKQFVIPRFIGISISDGSKYAEITHFAHI